MKIKLLACTGYKNLTKRNTLLKYSLTLGLESAHVRHWDGWVWAWLIYIRVCVGYRRWFFSYFYYVLALQFFLFCHDSGPFK